MYNRRAFIGAVAAGAALTSPTTPQAIGLGQGQPQGGPSAWRREFPALSQKVNGHDLVYLDSAATTLRARGVIDAMSRFYETDNANPGATLHTLARRAAQHYGSARARVASFLNASDSAEVIFTKGSTEALNLVASPGDPEMSAPVIRSW